MATAHQDELCYVLSPSYSGSTLLTFLLNTHPKIATIGELKARTDQDIGVPDFCSCGETMKSCRLWRRVADDLEGRGHPLDIKDFGTHFESRRHFIAHRLLRARIRGDIFERLRSVLLRSLPVARSELSRVLARNQLIIETILRLQGGTIFLDSSKDPIRLKWILGSRQWRIKVIHLVRDGRGTAWSFMKRTRIGMKSAALRFRRPHEQMESLARGLDPDQWLRLRYEDLASRPSQVLDTILIFLGLEAGPTTLDFRVAEHHVLGNPMRFQTSSEIVLDEAWRTELTSENLRIFERSGGDMNRRLGYID